MPDPEPVIQIIPPEEQVPEVRDLMHGLELRAAPAGSKSPGTMVGYAAVFNKYSCDLGMFREMIAPGAFSKVLRSCDVRALYNHDPGALLGRSSAGTLRLAEDDLGLRVELDLPDTSLGRDVAELIRSRNLQGQSFSFTASAERWDTGSNPAIRTVIEVEQLYDVGPVAFPAYEETSVALRSYRSAMQPPPPPPDPRIAIEGESDTARLRLLEVS